MKLRELANKDIEGMLEWMQDQDIIKCFRFPENKINIEEIKKFIENSFNNTNRHYGIVDNDDEYLGTVSLKNIDYINKNAEYAIVLRKKVVARGVATEATKMILDIAFNELKLHKVYLNVLENNIRAIKFYEKFGFKLEGQFREHIFARGTFSTIKWYSIIKEEYSSDTI
ncbi:MAG: GNAT family N-acetyltransferase [Cellulosilyticaceae bacterium]